LDPYNEKLLPLSYSIAERQQGVCITINRLCGITPTAGWSGRPPLLIPPCG
jgi:hypothetical protein